MSYDRNAHIVRLRAHLATRRGRRDLKARVRLARLLANKPSATLVTIDEILKSIYTAEAVPPNRIYFAQFTKVR